MQIVIQQPALPDYRIPFFKQIADLYGGALSVYYTTEDGLRNVSSEGFKAVWFRSYSVGGLEWHPAQIAAASQAESVAVFSWNLRNVTLPLALFKARKRGIGTILWGHGYSKGDNPFKRYLRSSLAAYATALVFYDEETAKAFSRTTGRREGVFVAPNTLDTKRIEEARRTWAGTWRLERFERSKQLSHPVVVFVSRVTYENRVDRLIRAVAELKPQWPSVTCIIIGDGPARGSLERLADSLGLSSNIRFPGAIYDETLLAPWMLSADLMCYPQNIGLSLLHAFAYGLPVVTSGNSQLQGPEIRWLVNGQNGLQFAHEDDRDMVSVLERILSDTELRQRLSRGARRTIEEEATLANMVSGFAEAVDYAEHAGISAKPSTRPLP